jgi:hypothetical protein
MNKRIAVLARDRQDESLRMAVGLTLADDNIDVFILDRKLQDSEKNRLNLETMELMDIKTYTNMPENAGIECLSTEEIALKLLSYDIVIPY